MKIVIEIEQCNNCPECNHNDRCLLMADDNRQPMQIEDTSEIPDWCPLPSVQEYCESNFNIDKH